jgi:hypothetical protein
VGWILNKYGPVVTLCTTRFKIKKKNLCSFHTVYLPIFFVWISEQPVIISYIALTHPFL